MKDLLRAIGAIIQVAIIFYFFYQYLLWLVSVGERVRAKLPKKGKLFLYSNPLLFLGMIWFVWVVVLVVHFDRMNEYNDFYEILGGWSGNGGSGAKRY